MTWTRESPTKPLGRAIREKVVVLLVVFAFAGSPFLFEGFMVFYVSAMTLALAASIRSIDDEPPPAR